MINNSTSIKIDYKLHASIKFHRVEVWNCGAQCFCFFFVFLDNKALLCWIFSVSHGSVSSLRSYSIIPIYLMVNAYVPV